jgi:hypothetical protein
MGKLALTVVAVLLMFCAVSCAHGQPRREPVPQRDATISSQEPTGIEEVERTEKTIPGQWEPKLK